MFTRHAIPLVVALSLLATGCPKVTPVPLEDGGPPRVDSGPIDRFQDTDGDGLCDDTELEWGTLLMDPDTDDDGLNDRVERQLGYDAFDPNSPDRELLVFLSENPSSSVQLPILRAVRGAGENYAGAFMPLPVPDRLDLDARSFFEGAVAVGAMPAENVIEVREEEERFISVNGRTQLFYEVRFAYGENIDRSCARVYPFQYEIRRDDGATAFFRRYTLIVLPRGQRLDTVEWCAPEGSPCL
ncbi:MAG: hypothetical protein AB8I08_19965 [Sandaracinaceae bacterium]